MRRVGIAALVLSAAWSFPLQAAVLELAPIPIEVTAPEKTGVLTLGNRASSEVTFQVRAFQWAQVEGQEKLTPTQDLAVSPSISVIPAGETLTVRVVRTARTPPTAEETYRIWVDELPTKGQKPKGGGALRILMRYSIPVFFEPENASTETPSLSWRLSRVKKKWQLSAHNAGARRVNFQGLQIKAPDGDAAVFAPGNEMTDYVLAGNDGRWTLQPPKEFPVVAGGRYRLSYKTGDELHRETLVLDAGK